MSADVQTSTGLYFTPASTLDPALGSGAFLLDACRLLLLVNPPWDATP